MEDEFWQEISEYEEEKKMPYMTSVERIGFKRGISEGRQKGMAEGWQQGILEGTLEAIEMGAIKSAVFYLLYSPAHAFPISVPVSGGDSSQRYNVKHDNRCL